MCISELLFNQTFQRSYSYLPKQGKHLQELKTALSNHCAARLKLMERCAPTRLQLKKTTE